MPRKGFKSLTLPEKTLEEIDKLRGKKSRRDFIIERCTVQDKVGTVQKKEKSTVQKESTVQDMNKSTVQTGKSTVHTGKSTVQYPCKCPVLGCARVLRDEQDREVHMRLSHANK